LGIDRGRPIHTPENRPVYLAAEGEFIADLL
jgi:hypothetical protein